VLTPPFSPEDEGRSSLLNVVIFKVLRFLKLLRTDDERNKENNKAGHYCKVRH
jgi:hypothetical protein